MGIRKIPFLLGEYYHIYNRGVDKRVIFLNKADYNRFVALLYLCNSTEKVHMQKQENGQGKALTSLFNIDRGDFLVEIVAYCLMPNHFHILVREKTEGGISKFMQKFSTAYTMYFNEKYERSGTLLGGKFKAKHIDNNPYLNWIFSYIHTNPIKLIESDWKENGISDFIAVKNFIENYKYSSYYDYFVGNRKESIILNKDTFSDNLEQLNDFTDLVNKTREEI